MVGDSMDSSFDQISPPLETLEATNEIIISVDSSPLRAASTGEKRKREGRLRSRVWQHFTKLEKRPGEREECQCNHCGQFYVCSNRSGTTHLNRHIFDGGCTKYKPPPNETQKQLDYGNDGLDDDTKFLPGRPDRVNGLRYHDQAEQEIAQLKEENARLQQEKDALAEQKSNLEQLVVSMASETARLVEENNKLKEQSFKLQEEKQKNVTREEFTRLEDQVTKLREDFERDRRGFPAVALAAITQLQKNK